MKANELMIGDWFQTTYPNGKVEFRKVECVMQNHIVCNNGITNAFEPVPLTAEMLEKNFSSTPIWYFEGTDKHHLRITPYKDKWHFFFGRDGKGTYIQINIQYVHELQHALRLCGIDKEIVL